MSPIQIQPIGVIRSPFKQASGTPIQPAFAAGAEGVVELDPRFSAALKDLDGFERIWLLYWFHQAAPPRLTVQPYMDDKAEHGLFATRAPCRPNPIGMSAVRLLRITGCHLHVTDIDILDGTPLLDIKPYVPKFDHFEVKRIGWLSGAVGRVIADERFS
jgi:tRNA-Thr(GGU) m(6)t(6)A37 methyltransferase TsaA